MTATCAEVITWPVAALLIVAMLCGTVLVLALSGVFDLRPKS